MYLALLGIELAGVELLAEIAQYRPAASKYSDSKADETMTRCSGKFHGPKIMAPEILKPEIRTDRVIEKFHLQKYFFCVFTIM